MWGAGVLASSDLRALVKAVKAGEPLKLPKPGNLVFLWEHPVFKERTCSGHMLRRDIRESIPSPKNGTSPTRGANPENGFWSFMEPVSSPSAHLVRGKVPSQLTAMGSWVVWIGFPGVPQGCVDFGWAFGGFRGAKGSGGGLGCHQSLSPKSLQILTAEQSFFWPCIRLVFGGNSLCAVEAPRRLGRGAASRHSARAVDGNPAWAGLRRRFRVGSVWHPRRLSCSTRDVGGGAV